MALSTLCVAERDSDAPNTAMAETRASPTINADAVWAVRRGLRIEFSRPNRPDIPSTRLSGRPMTLDIGRATAGASLATPTKISDGTEADELNGRRSQAGRERGDPGQRDHRAPGEAPAQGDLVLDLLLRDGIHGRDPHRAAGRSDGGDHRHGTPTTRQTITVRVWNTSGPDGSVTPNPLNSASRPECGEHAEPESDERRHQTHDPGLGQHDTKTCRRLAPTMRRSATPSCVGPR